MNLEYILFGIGILIAGYFLIKALIRIIKGIISYKKLGKEEFKRRLKEGFEEITPTQKAKIELRGIFISLIGLILGVIVVPIYRIEGFWYWVEITLIGGLIVTIMQLIGKLQEYWVLKKQDEIMEELKMEEKTK